MTNDAPAKAPPTTSKLSLALMAARLLKLDKSALYIELKVEKKKPMNGCRGASLFQVAANSFAQGTIGSNEQMKRALLE